MRFVGAVVPRPRHLDVANGVMSMLYFSVLECQFRACHLCLAESGLLAGPESHSMFSLGATTHQQESNTYPTEWQRYVMYDLDPQVQYSSLALLQLRLTARI